MFQSKLFKRLFFSYILIITVSMVMYSGFLFLQSRKVSQEQSARMDEYVLRGVSDEMEDHLQGAMEAVQNLRYSSVMRDLYMSVKLDQTLTSFQTYAVQEQMRSVFASHSSGIYNISLFLYGSDVAYTGGGTIFLDTPFPSEESLGGSLPLLTVDTAANALQISDNSRYIYDRTDILYADRFTYQNGPGVGVVCVIIDLKEVQRSLAETLGEDHAVRILYDGKEILSLGNAEKMRMTVTSDSLHVPGLSYELYAAPLITLEEGLAFCIMFLLILLVSAGFVALAYFESKRYYRPIGYLERMVSAEPGEKPQEELLQPENFSPSRNDREMDSIIDSIRALIVEKNSYRERMVTIGRYAETGMLHSIVSGGEGGEKIGILSNEEYLNLKHSYYIVSAVNFAYDDSTPLEKDLRGELEQVFKRAAEGYSTEEMHIAWYFRDVCNAYLIVNFDELEDSDELFFGLHRQIGAALADRHILVSMGIDQRRDELTELKEACESALSALDGVLRDGRGEVFFAEESAGEHMDYYLPESFRERLKSCLEKGDRQGIHDLLFDIYRKNLNLDAPAEVYRSLLDEIYPAIVKTVREISGPSMTHLNIRRTDGLMTLQEIFDYYDAVLMSVIDLTEQSRAAGGEEERLDEEILRYVEEHFCDSELSLQQLSDLYGVSNKYLVLLFKRRYNMTYLQYLQNKRIAKAAEMIRRSEQPLSEIGFAVGYPNQLTFRRNFKAVMGVNPSEYIPEN